MFEALNPPWEEVAEMTSTQEQAINQTCEPASIHDVLLEMYKIN